MAGKKIIAFDGLNLALHKGTGIATYTRNTHSAAKRLGYDTSILYATRRTPPRDPLLREVTFFDDRDETSFISRIKRLNVVGEIATNFAGVRAQEVPISGAVLTQPLGTRWIDPSRVYAARDVFERARRHFAITGRLLEVVLPQKADVFHWTYPMPIRARGAANIYTIHDLIPLRLPYTTLDWKSYFLKSTQAIIDSADRIVTVSEASKRDILDHFRVDDQRITNTFQAVDLPAALTNRSDAEVAAELSGIFGLRHRGYFLFYGSLEPKKNLGRVIQAYLAANPKEPLVVIVAQSWRGDDETRLMAQEQVKKRQKILQFDYMPFPLLVSIIQGARGVLFPSLYEGFGLPILEAMTLGTPVITSRVSSMPEVAGDSTLLVDPYNVGEIQAAISALAADDDLGRDLSKRGRERAELFSIGAYGRRLQSLYSLVA